jgi:hypothetical protein
MRPAHVMCVLTILLAITAAPQRVYAAYPAPVGLVPAVVDGPPDPAAAPMRLTASVPAPIIGYFMKSVLSWAAGDAASRAVDRYLLAQRGRDAIGHTGRLQQDTRIPGDQRRELARIEADLRRYTALLEQRERSDAEVQAALAMLRDDIVEVSERVASLEERLSALEREQKRQLMMLVDQQGQILALSDRVSAVESIVLPDPHRWLRHEAYIGGSATVARASDLGHNTAVGLAVSGQYNFTKYLGMFADLHLSPHSASDAMELEAGASATWDNFGIVAGPTVNLITPRSLLSLQLAGGIGVVQSRLRYYAPGVERNPDTGRDVGSMSGLAGQMKVEVGVAPPAFEFEPLIGFGMLHFFNDVHASDATVDSRLGSQYWYVSLGIRFRQYLRKRPEER